MSGRTTLPGIAGLTVGDHKSAHASLSGQYSCFRTISDGSSRPAMKGPRGITEYPDSEEL